MQTKPGCMQSRKVNYPIEPCKLSRVPPRALKPELKWASFGESQTRKKLCGQEKMLPASFKEKRIPRAEAPYIPSTMVTMVTMGGDLQPGRLADRLVAGLCQPKINP
eukprot:1162108-Pelagomonas_calceolata.AAC.1